MTNAPKPAGSPLHLMNLVVALLAGIVSITGGVYTLKNNFFPSPSYGSLQGVIRDEKLARPLWLASVEISSADGSVINTATTDKEGRYAIQPIKAGSYDVKFSAALHRNQVKTVKIEKDLTSTINVDLIPENDPGVSVKAEQNYTQVHAPAVSQAALQATSSAAVPAVPAAASIPSSVSVPASSYPSYSSQSGSDDHWSSSPVTQRRPYRRPNPYGRQDGMVSSSGSGDSMGNLLTQIVQQFEKRKASEN